LRKLAIVLALAAILAAAGTAGADVGFTTDAARPPSFSVPNGPGSIAVPSPLSQPPAVPEQRSYEQLLALWKHAGAAYGVSWQVLGAINKIESDFGRNMGPSSAGAVGWMQFMPGTWARWGVDADGNGVADPWNPEDAVYAAARYLAAAGGQTDIARAVLAYNHAQWYVDEVLGLARLFGDTGGGFGSDLTDTIASPQLVLQVDDLARKLADARSEVAGANQALVAARMRTEPLNWKKLALEQRAGDPSLSDAKFRRLEAAVTRVAVALDRAQHTVEVRRQALEYAVSALDELKKQQAEASVAPPAAAMLGGGSSGSVSISNQTYVFPVGGGPGVVSVSHTHHDYPAADIVAPEGTPVFALADAVVLDSYQDPRGLCGIGLRMQIGDGTIYVYCHLAYLEPDVQTGAALTAGAQVGLVGHTGHATGPHLHLQFSPATSFPQNEPWFQSFAGRAFRWSDAPTPAPAQAASTTQGATFQAPSAPVVGFTTP
jgi:murein DD-endopeptidase MepM/ murein hydrolase activator NlpD